MEMQTCILISQAIMKVHNESVAFIHVNLRYRPFPIDPDDFAREFVVGICSGPGGGEVVCYRFCESGGGEEEKYTKQLLRKSHVARKCQQHAHCFVPADERALVYNISNGPAVLIQAFCFLPSHRVGGLGQLSILGLDMIRQTAAALKISASYMYFTFLL